MAENVSFQSSDLQGAVTFVSFGYILSVFFVLNMSHQVSIWKNITPDTIDNINSFVVSLLTDGEDNNLEKNNTIAIINAHGTSNPDIQILHTGNM